MSFAWQAIWTNKLRTFLSLLGVMVGIFVISAVFTVVDSLEGELRDTFNMLDDDVLFVTKWPWTSEGEEDYPWWKYVQRRPPSEADLDRLMPRLSLAEAGMYQNKAFLDAEAGNNRMPGVVIGGGSHDYDKVISLNIEHGRYFTHSESAAGSPVAIVGHDVAMQLFGRPDAIGEHMKLKGIRVEVIGVFAQEGESIVSTGMDEFALVPSSFSPRIYDVRNADDAQIAIKARPGVELDAHQPAGGDRPHADAAADHHGGGQDHCRDGEDRPGGDRGRVGNGHYRGGEDRLGAGHRRDGDDRHRDGNDRPEADH